MKATSSAGGEGLPVQSKRRDDRYTPSYRGKHRGGLIPSRWPMRSGPQRRSIRTSLR